MQDVLPACVGLLPILWRGNFDARDAAAILTDLLTNGSKASCGFHDPEGIVIFHIAGNVGFKKTLEKDNLGKTLTPSHIKAQSDDYRRDIENAVEDVIYHAEDYDSQEFINAVNKELQVRLWAGLPKARMKACK